MDTVNGADQEQDVVTTCMSEITRVLDLVLVSNGIGINWGWNLGKAFADGQSLIESY